MSDLTARQTPLESSSRWTPGLETHKAFERRVQHPHHLPAHHHCHARMHPQHLTHHYTRPEFSPDYRSQLHPYISFAQPPPPAAHFHIHPPNVPHRSPHTYNHYPPSSAQHPLSPRADEADTTPTHSHARTQAGFECEEAEAGDQSETHDGPSHEEEHETCLVFAGYEEPEDD
ncbi:hypothetical protein P171DRAFT_431173 [Karstenula rhodostoma CBS 690.94]|uniref:Uncharacterized protein n=1 Tax=Karstenula rhodostoma CBS 690.94 TaxID=1392251 RepID=A0A9P4PIN7_9PLEO|nr:hypothetical protein P171DRAFT_431173 [Karstenula rhodostoma CBS 690.94]